MSAATVLREAAALMRERAEAVDGWWIGTEGMLNPLPVEDRMHLASWHPAVALAVADWLEGEADCQHPHAWDVARRDRALAVATAYLGTSP